MKLQALFTLPFQDGNIALLFHHTACIKVRGGMGGQFHSASDTPADVVTEATEASPQFTV